MGRQEIFGYDKGGSHKPVYQTSGCLHTYLGGYKFASLIGSNDTNAKTGLDITTHHGMLHGVNINTSTAAGSLSLWSNHGNAGSLVIANINVATGTAPANLMFDTAYISGLYVFHSDKLVGHFTITYL